VEGVRRQPGEDQLRSRESRPTKSDARWNLRLSGNRTERAVEKALTTSQCHIEDSALLWEPTSVAGGIAHGRLPGGHAIRSCRRHRPPESGSVTVAGRTPSTPLRPSPSASVTNMGLTFSQFKYFKECPYQFKLRFLYGFNAPLEEALGYGKSLHDTLAEIHKQHLLGRSQRTTTSRTSFVDTYMCRSRIPSCATLSRRRRSVPSVSISDRTGVILTSWNTPKQVVELELGDGIIVNGRIDLIRHTDTGEIAVVDFKSNERSQDEDVSRMQLHIYTVGYRALTGRSADLIEVHELERGRVQREIVDEAMERTTLAEIGLAAASLRSNHLPRLASWSPRPAGDATFGASAGRRQLAEVTNTQPSHQLTLQRAGVALCLRQKGITAEESQGAPGK